MKVLLDTNIVLDVLLERNPFVSSAREIFLLVEGQKIDAFLCATTITTLHYLVGRKLGKKEADHAISQLLTLFDVTPVTKEVLWDASSEPSVDYEDRVLYLSASYSDIDFIITRDQKGFITSPVPSLSPVEFLAFYKAGETL